MKRLTGCVWFTLCLVYISSPCNAEELSPPSHEIGKLQKAVRSAVNAAEKVNEAQRAIESKKESFEMRREEVETCLNFPESFDLMGDNCQFVILEYQSAKSKYENAAYDYTSKLNDLERELTGLESIILQIKTTTGKSYDFDYCTQCSKKIEEINSFYQEAKKLLQ